VGICFPFWFAPSKLASSPSSLCQAGLGCQLPHLRPPLLPRATTASRPPRAAQLRASGAAESLPPRLHFPSLNSPHSPPPLSSMALKPLRPALTPATPPRCSPDPYKRRAPPLDFTAPLPASLRFSPRSSVTLTERRHLRFCTTVARPPRRRPSSGEARAELLMLLSHFCAPAGELWGTGAAGGRTSVSAPPCSGTLCPRHRWSTVDRARLAGSPRVDPVHDLYRWKIIR
jgi:hypothetical protein